MVHSVSTSKCSQSKALDVETHLMPMKCGRSQGIQSGLTVKLTASINRTDEFASLLYEPYELIESLRESSDWLTQSAPVNKHSIDSLRDLP